MRYYDFRSDTVTRPTAEMREAMYRAEVGDDVYGEDPTVNKLENLAAQMLGKEAAIFVTSGTMGNLAAVLAVCARGDEAIMGTQGHTMLHEAGGVSALGGVVIHTVPNLDDGTLDLEDLPKALRTPGDVHEPISRMLIIENTQNACGGIPISAEYTEKAAEFAHMNGLWLHVDGARIFNAAIALEMPASSLVRSADSITFCLSKGLCAPVGSVLCGPKPFIHKARRLRKMLGGGMRQAGVLAAAGIVALESMVDRLAEDHQRAKALAEGLSSIPGVELIKHSPTTNMVFIRVASERKLSNEAFIAHLKSQGVLINDTAPCEFRLVTHHDIDDEAVAQCVQAMRTVLQQN